MANRSDTFAGASGALGTPSDGGSAWQYATTAGAGWTRDGSGKCANSYDAGSNRYYGYLECSEADGTVAVTLSVVTGASSQYMGLAARVSGTDDLWVVRADNGIFQLIKFVAGGATIAGSWGTGASNGDLLEWVLSGNSHTVKVNGVTRITASDSFNSTATKHGLHGNAAYSTGARWDDFAFTGAGGGGGVITSPFWYERAYDLAGGF